MYCPAFCMLTQYGTKWRMCPEYLINRSRIGLEPVPIQLIDQYRLHTDS